MKHAKKRRLTPEQINRLILAATVRNLPENCREAHLIRAARNGTIFIADEL